MGFAEAFIPLQVRKFLAPVIISLFLLCSFPNSGFQSAHAQSTSCTSNDTFNMTLVYPPTSHNALDAAGNTAFTLIAQQFDSTFPTATPSGAPFMDTAFDTYASNSNYTVWTFNVRPGLRWSDGTNASAQDLLATYGPNFAFNATYDFPNAAAEVTKEYAINNSAVVFDLNQSDAHWPERLSYMYFTPVYPASSIAKEGAAGTMFDAPAVGPFYISNYTVGSFQMTMLRNPYYKPLPAICQIDVNFVESLSLTANFLQSGTTDLALVEPSNVASILKNPNLLLFDGKELTTQMIQWNVTSYPYNMTQFRQALAFGIDESAIASQANAGYATPAFNAEGTVPQSAALLYNPNQMKYSFNQSQSISLLKSIGITKGSDGFLHYSNGTVVTLTLWTDTDQTPDQTAASLVQTDLQNMGFKVTLFTTTLAGITSNYQANLNNAKNAMILYTTNGGNFGSSFLDVLPGWDQYYLVTAPSNYWEYPPSAQAEYQSNFSAYSATNNVTLERQYTQNIEAISAKYLPMLPLDYSDLLWVANTQRWTGWPNPQTSYVEFGTSTLNRTLIAGLIPSSQASSSSSSITATGSSPSSSTASLSASSSSGTQTSTTSLSTSSLTTQVSATTTGSGQVGINLSLVAAVVVVIVILAIAYGVVRSRRSRTTPAGAAPATT